MSDPAHSIGPNANETTQKVYLSHFDFSHWAIILKLVCDVSGPAFDEQMARFNDPDSLVSDSIHDRIIHFC